MKDLIQQLKDVDQRLIMLSMAILSLIVVTICSIIVIKTGRKYKELKKELDWHQKVANGWRNKFLVWKYQEELRLNEPARREATEKAFEMAKIIGKDIVPKGITLMFNEIYSCLTGK